MEGSPLTCSVTDAPDSRVQRDQVSKFSDISEILEEAFQENSLQETANKVDGKCLSQHPLRFPLYQNLKEIPPRTERRVVLT